VLRDFLLQVVAFAWRRLVVNGAAQVQDSAPTTAAAEIKWPNGSSAAFEGEFVFVTRSYAGKGVVRIIWSAASSGIGGEAGAGKKSMDR
jgi:hypothetical protein